MLNEDIIDIDKKYFERRDIEKMAESNCDKLLVLYFTEMECSKILTAEGILEEMRSHLSEFEFDDQEE